MRPKKFFCMLLTCAVLMGCFIVDAGAVNEKESGIDIALPRATGSFSVEIPGDSFFTADSSFPMEAGETITIKASYSPFSASVDFGFIDSDGVFYFVNTKNGSIDKTIRVSRHGNYTFAIQNNSSNTVNVSGYINY